MKILTGPQGIWPRQSKDIEKSAYKINKLEDVWHRRLFIKMYSKKLETEASFSVMDRYHTESQAFSDLQNSGSESGKENASFLEEEKNILSLEQIISFKFSQEKEEKKKTFVTENFPIFSAEYVKTQEVIWGELKFRKKKSKWELIFNNLNSKRPVTPFFASGAAV